MSPTPSDVRLARPFRVGERATVVEGAGIGRHRPHDAVDDLVQAHRMRMIGAGMQPLDFIAQPVGAP